jgi:hypothetical protein
MPPFRREAGDEGGLAEEALQREVAIIDELRSYLKVTRPPPGILGNRRSGIIDKFCLAMHMLYLQTGSSQSLTSFVDEFQVSTTDQGIEFGISSVQPVPVKSVLPWIKLESEGPQEDDWFEAGADEQALGPKVSFQNQLSAAGMLHIFDNIGNDVLSASPVLDEQVTRMSKVADLVRKPDSCDRLCESCFSCPVGRTFQKGFRRFKGKVHRKRWGTVAFCVTDILGIKASIIWGWNKSRYVGHHGASNVRQDPNHSIAVDDCDDAILDPFFWACLLTLEWVYVVLRHIFAWIEECPCHGTALDSHPTPAQKKAWLKCPLRCLRLIEVCAGDLLDELKQLLTMCSVELLTQLPPDLTIANRAVCVREFEKVRSYILFQSTLKIAPMMEAPFCSIAVAHYNRSKAKLALRKCLDSNSTHRRIIELKSEPLLSEALAFLEDVDPQELEHFIVFQGELRFASGSERAVEGEHARFHRFVSHAPHHSMAYDSLAQRIEY